VFSYVRMKFSILPILLLFCGTGAPPFMPWPSAEDTDHDASNVSNSSSSDSESSSDSDYYSQSEEDQLVLSLGRKCTKMEFAKRGKCLPCTLCGPDLYVREACQPDKDTLCDWCFSKSTLKNDDYKLKCFTKVDIQNNGFEQLFRVQPAQLRAREQEIGVVFVEPDPAPYVSFSTVKEPFVLAKHSHLQSSWKAELLIEASFYLVLIGVIFAVIRFISRSRPYYRTVTVNPPLLNEHDNKDIIRAAESIRIKLGKKGYDRLEEFI